MKLRRHNIEIFTISFLDIISSAFAAVVLLVLISKPLPNPLDLGATESLLKQVVSAESQLSDSARELEKKRQELARLQQINSLLQASEKGARKEMGDKTNQLEKLDGDLDGLSLVQSSLNRASIRPSSATVRDEEVGGIPVDSDYIIFIVDTSGSMLQIWNSVSKTVLNVLKIHPKVKGFQIMNDNGMPLISSYSGKWIRDTPQRRKSVMNVFGAWKSASNSSPVEGLEVALKKYAKPNISLSIYIFGDDYTGASYDAVIDSVDALNRNKITGKKLAKIHAVGFMSNYATNRFSILMREVTQRNGGTFLALPYDQNRATGMRFQ
ncbi:hypothetical protein D8Y20_08965 [Mariprofundus sp. EBB-1]|uniref:hypothetical protein n=1 Tax=Mariprofundus sp. EBB-1 TaxID=2650971 RepID=UPI000EF29204|nr:hypothetical protein [Mariprofundus sp. EBB-1]RLL51605.1 hypothetical protein D8Y20_08965 [Mariprofundus sp. EBB-1]